MAKKRKPKETLAAAEAIIAIVDDANTKIRRAVPDAAEIESLQLILICAVSAKLRAYAGEDGKSRAKRRGAGK